MKNAVQQQASFEGHSNYFSIQTGNIVTISSLLTLAPLVKKKDIHTAFFLNVFNSMRQAQHSKKLGCDFIDFEKIGVTALKNKAANIHLPTFVHAHARNAAVVQSLKENHLCQHEIVSAFCADQLESKCNTALAFAKMNDPQQREQLIEAFAKTKQLTEQDVAAMKAVVGHFFPQSGVVKATNLSDAQVKLKLILQKHQSTGVVFQVDKSVGGKGTTIFKPADIQRILAADACITSEIATQSKYQDKARMLQEMSEAGLSYQELVLIEHELCFTLRKDTSANAFKLDSVSQQHVGEVGHIGNTIYNVQEFQKKQPQLQAYLHLTELVVDVMLKDAGVKEGLQAIFKESPSKDNQQLFLEVLGPDFFQTDKGLVLSEINARFPAFSRSLASAEHMRSRPMQLPIVALKTDDVRFSKEIIHTLEHYSPEDVSQFLAEVLKPVLDQHSQGLFEGFKIHNNYEAHNDADYVRMTVNFLFGNSKDDNATHEKILLQQATGALRAITPAQITAFMIKQGIKPITEKKKQPYTINGHALSSPAYVPGPVHASLQTKFLKNIGSIPSVIPAQGFPVTQAFIGVFNRIREAEGHQPLQAFPLDLNKLDTTTIQMLLPAPVPFYVSQRELPNVAKLQEKGVLERVIVSPHVHSIVESKCATARAFAALQSSHAAELINVFLDRKGITEQSVRSELLSLMQQSIPRSGVINSSQQESSDDIHLKLRQLLLSFADRGIVFQKNSCSSGKGTVLLKPAQIQTLLASDTNLVHAIEKQMQFKKYFAGDLQQEIAKNGLSYQELVSFKDEVGLNFVYDKTNAAFEIKAINIQQIGEIGNIGGTLFPLNETKSMTGVDLNPRLFGLMTECVLDVILKQNGVHQGVEALNNADQQGQQGLSALETFGVDAFSDGSRFILSEFNARPTSTSRALYALAHLSQTPLSLPVHRLETDEVTFSKPVIDTLLKHGEEGAYAYLHHLLKPFYEKTPGMMFDAIRISENYSASSEHDHIRLCIGFFFTQPKDIHNAAPEKQMCKGITQALRAVQPEDVNAFFQQHSMNQNRVVMQKPMSMQPQSQHLPKVAVVGAGLTGSSLVSGLLAAVYDFNSSFKPEIHLFDIKGHFSTGTPYSIHQTPLHLLNQPADNMGSLNISQRHRDDDHFYHWVLARKESLLKDYPALEFKPNAYWPRSLYGRYLQDQYAQIEARAASLNTSIQRHDGFVSDLSEANGPYPLGITAAQRQRQGFDKAVLALGGWVDPSSPFKGAEGHYFKAYDAGYIDPANIKPNATMAIKGTGLSAIDVAIHSLESGLYDKVLMHSRGGLLRQVRPDVVKPYTRQHFTLDNVQKLKRMNALDVQSVMNLLQMELQVAYRGKDVPNFKPKTMEDILNHFDQGIANHKANQSEPWYDLFKSLPAQERHAIFDLLSSKQRQDFREQLGALYTTIIAPVSITNAEKLQAYIRDGRVQIINGATDVQFNLEDKHFTIANNTLADDIVVDRYIDATGAQRDARLQPLLNHEIQKGDFKADAEGGVQLDYKTKEIKSDTLPGRSVYGIGPIGNGQSILNFSSNSAARQGFALGYRLGQELMFSA